MRNWPRWWRRFQLASRRVKIFPILEAVSVIAFLIATLTSWAALSSQAVKGQLLPSALTASLLVGTLLPAMAILVLLGRRMALRRAAETMGRGGGGGTGRLHVQLVFLFSLVAAIPTLLVVIFASFLFQSGVEFWFSDNSRGLLENANKLARGYYEQTQRDVSNQAVAMADDLHYMLSQASIVSPQFAEGLSYQVLQRGLDEVAILQKAPDGRLRTAAIVDPGKNVTRQRVTTQELRRIDAGEPIVVNATADRIEAVTPIDRATGLYLYVARTSDLLALSQGRSAENIVRAYQVLTQRARLLQLRFNVALFVVPRSRSSACRCGSRCASPIGRCSRLYDLVSAARRVGSGQLRDARRQPQQIGDDEIGLLNRAFNRMTAQIERQTLALVGANQQLDERRALYRGGARIGDRGGDLARASAGAVLLINSARRSKLLLGPEHAGPPPLG